MRRPGHYFAVLACVALASCATAPPPQDVDYGAPPAHYMDAVHRYLDEILKDPSTAQYRELSAPFKGYVQAGLLYGGRRTYGWMVNVEVNAKNSYGGYVGFRTYSFLFRGEQLVDVIPPPDE